MKLSYDPVIPLLCIYPKNSNHFFKDYMHPYVHCTIISNSHNMEATQVPIYRQVDKNAVVHIYSGILLGHKKNEMSPL